MLKILKSQNLHSTENDLTFCFCNFSSYSKDQGFICCCRDFVFCFVKCGLFGFFLIKMTAYCPSLFLSVSVSLSWLLSSSEFTLVVIFSSLDQPSFVHYDNERSLLYILDMKKVISISELS